MVMISRRSYLSRALVFIGMAVVVSQWLALFRMNTISSLRRMYDTLMSNLKCNDDVLHSSCCSHDAPCPMLIANVEQNIPKYCTSNRSMYRSTSPRVHQQC